MSNDDDYAPDEEAGRACSKRCKTMRADRLRRRSMIHEYRRVAAEVERTGNQSLFADFQRRFLMALALLYPPETHVAGEARDPR